MQFLIHLELFGINLLKPISFNVPFKFFDDSFRFTYKQESYFFSNSNAILFLSSSLSLVLPSM